jgi:uncharacterized protein
MTLSRSTRDYAPDARRIGGASHDTRTRGATGIPIESPTRFTVSSVIRPEEALRSPAIYPDRPKRLDVIETHISWVFLADERAYKLRKPVVFPFLDYGTPERRRAMCEEEVRLGRRLAPDLYMGVRPLVRTAQGWRFGEPDATGDEHVVEMRRFDEGRTLASMIHAGRAGPDDIRAVARAVAEFHARAEPAPAERFGVEAVVATVSENFGTLLPYAQVVGASRLAGAHRFAAAFMHGKRELLHSRAAAGFVRDCHGDMRAEHVLLEDGRVEVFDPVEFAPELREIDVSADLAFLVMDLTDAGADDLAAALLSEYERAGGDHGGRSLLFFYAAYRAWVRAKVACLRAMELADERTRAEPLAEAARLAANARRLAWRARRPLVLVVCGPSAGGKTNLARALSDVAGLPHLNSDVVRKQMAGLEPTAHATTDDYSEQASRRTYSELGARAAASHEGAVVDATFRRSAHRSAFAETFRGRAVFVECRAPAELISSRACAREDDPANVSDATAALAMRQVAEFEPLDEVPAERHLTLRTDCPVETMLDDARQRSMPACERALRCSPSRISVRRTTAKEGSSSYVPGATLADEPPPTCSAGLR